MNRNCILSGIFYRLIAASLLLFIFILLTEPNTIYADNGNTVVHITNTGACYHRADCGHLRSDIEITLYEATKEGYNPCEDCNPPIYDGPPITDAEPIKQKHSGGSGVSSKPLAENKSSTRSSSSSEVREVVDSQTKKETDSWIIYGILFVIVGLPVLFTTNGIIQESIEKKKRKKEFEIERQSYCELYEGKDPLSFVDVPEGVFLKDGYPCTANEKKGVWGDYTVYVAQKNRRVFHLKSRCGRTNLVPINYYQACRLRHCKKCAVGKITLPELDWYIKYLEIKSIKEKYEIQ